MTLHLSALHVLAALGALIVLLTMWRASVRRAKRIAKAAKEGTRTASLAGSMLVSAAVLAGLQWVLITHPGHPVLLGVVLGLPDLVAGFVLVRALTVTALDDRRKEGRR